MVQICVYTLHIYVISLHIAICSYYPIMVQPMGTRGQWSRDFLSALGNTNPSQDTVKFVSAWTKAENTRAAFNPLATTQPYENATDFNSVGVKNYANRSDGIAASVKTISSSFAGYSALKNALLTNDPTRALASGGLDTWGSRSSHVGIIYAGADTSSELLLSDQAEDTSTAQPGQRSTEQSSATPTVQSVSSTEGPVSGQDIRNIGKIFLGIGLIGASAFVFIYAVFKNESIQQTAKVAVKAAI